MNKLKYLFLLLLISNSSCLTKGVKDSDRSKIEEVKRPNIIFILADDFGLEDMSFVGSTFYETPNIDRLAAQSMVFTQGYAGSRVCSPSRATIMTGKFTARHGVTDWIGAKHGEDWRTKNREDKLLPADYKHNLPHEDETLAEVLKDNGYHTFFAGKWHLGEEGSYPEDHGFQVNKGGWHRGAPNGGYYAPFKNPKLEDKFDSENLTIRLANETVDFISQQKDASFFAFLSFYAVHGPIQTTKEKWQKYRNKAHDNGMTESGFTMEKKLPIRTTQDNPIYAGLVETMDDAIGIVLDGLEAAGVAENTIVIFTSDNGGVSSGDAFSTSNLPFRGGKGYQWEGGIREPYLIAVPNKKSANKKSDYPVSGADFFPTILDYAGIDLLPEQHKDGISLRSIIDEGIVPEKRALYWHYPHYGNQGGDPSSIIRDGEWKLIHYYEENNDELYDIINDPYEQNDLAKARPKTTKQLHVKLMNWLKEVSALYPVNDEEFNKTKRAAYDSKIRNQLLSKLEEQRLNFLSKDFEAKDNWWGSQLTKD